MVCPERNCCPALDEAVEKIGATLHWYASAENFLDHGKYLNAPSVLVTEFHLPGESGLALQKTLLRDSINLPVIMFTARPTVQAAVVALERGAEAFVTLPADAYDLAKRIGVALHRQRRAVYRTEMFARLSRQFKTITPREREVLDELIRGRTAAEIGKALYLSPKTVENHLARIRQKAGARNSHALMCDYVRYTLLLDKVV